MKYLKPLFSIIAVFPILGSGAAEIPMCAPEESRAGFFESYLKIFPKLTNQRECYGSIGSSDLDHRFFQTELSDEMFRERFSVQRTEPKLGKLVGSAGRIVFDGREKSEVERAEPSVRLPTFEGYQNRSGTGRN